MLGGTLFTGVILQPYRAVCLSFKARYQYNFAVWVTPPTYYFFLLHLRLATPYARLQLVDMLAYETRGAAARVNTLWLQFGGAMLRGRLSVLTCGAGVYSVTELFSSANWLERETAELSGVSFYGKRDLRNLMLPFGDSTTPLMRGVPAVGVREISYCNLRDVLYWRPVSLQY